MATCGDCRTVHSGPRFPRCVDRPVGIGSQSDKDIVASNRFEVLVKRIDLIPVLSSGRPGPIDFRGHIEYSFLIEREPVHLKTPKILRRDFTYAPSCYGCQVK